ncbi:MAG: hypothetical protein QM315_04820 [Bacillota bacterium]|jgi:hypothetical protein|nr:hypothetical protein [Bacillota bacterium]NLV64025.1 hypothetical protein [Clostridiaceae bacterium]
MKRRINNKKMLELMKKNCHGNYNLFGRELGVDPAHLYRFLNTGVGGGKKMIFALIKYCESHNLNFTHYLELD